MGGGLESRCVGRVCGANVVVRVARHTICTVHTTYAVALKTTIHLETRCKKPYAATQHLMLVMMGVCTRNMSSYEYINKISLLHQVGISNYFMRKMHGQTTLMYESNIVCDLEISNNNY